MRNITIILGLVLVLLLASCVEKTATTTTSTDTINIVEESTLEEPEQETKEGELGTIWLPAECEVGEPFQCEKYEVTDAKIRLIVSAKSDVYVTKIYGEGCEDYMVGKDFATREELEVEITCSDLESTNRKPLFIQFNHQGSAIQSYADVIMRY